MSKKSIIISTLITIIVVVFLLLIIIIVLATSKNNDNNQFPANEDYEEINGFYTINFFGNELEFFVDGYYYYETGSEYLFFRDSIFTSNPNSSTYISFSFLDGYKFIDKFYFNSSVEYNHWTFFNLSFTYTDELNKLFFNGNSDYAKFLHIPSYYDFINEKVVYMDLIYLDDYFTIEIIDENNLYFENNHFIIYGSRLEILNYNLSINSDFFITILN